MSATPESRRAAAPATKARFGNQSFKKERMHAACVKCCRWQHRAILLFAKGQYVRANSGQKLIEQQRAGRFTDQEFAFVTIWLALYTGMAVIMVGSKVPFSILQIAAFLF
jgi:hypothetical protein